MALVVAGIPMTASAASPDGGFYSNKEVNVLVGGEPGGGYDTFARTVMRYFPEHTPGRPTIVVRNMTGAGSMTMANHVANAAPKDGTVIGAPQNGIAVEQLLRLLAPDGTAGKFNAKAMNWIGSPTQDVFLLLAWHTSRAKSLEDLKSIELVVGAEGAGTDGSVATQLLNSLVGTKIKTIRGYKGSSARQLAMERGEIDGDATSYSTLMTRTPDWVREGKVRILVQMAVEKSPLLPDVPFILDFIDSPNERRIAELVFSKLKIGRPLFVADGVPQDRVATLRQAFDLTMQDDRFLKDARQRHLHVEPVSGPDLQALITRLNDTPEDLAQRTRDILKGS